jgi:hypothetical protein
MSGEIPNLIPSPYYTLIETTRGLDPAIVVVNSALRTFAHRNNFPWHLSIQISCRTLGTNGMPTAAESTILGELEDAISSHVLAGANSVFLARITCHGTRELMYRVHDPEIANTPLERMTSEPEPLREWEYRIEHDPTWKLADPELCLLEHDPRIN